MREGWTIKQLGDLCTIRPPKKETRAKLDDNAEVGFLPMEDLGIRQQAVTTSQTRALGEVYKSYTYFADGDVLLAKITPCFQNGKLGIARDLPNGVGFGSSEYFVLRSNGEILPEYLFYFLSQDSFIKGGVRQMSGAVGHQRVPPEYVASQKVPLPPLAEQKRIVAILDEAFEAIERAEEVDASRQASAAVLVQAAIDDYLDEHAEAVQPLEQDVRFIDYRGRTPPKTESGLPLITAKNVRMGFVKPEPQEFVDPGIYETWMTRGIPKEGDVLFTTEAPLGNVAVLDRSDRVVFAQRVIVLQPDRTRLNPIYLQYVLRSTTIQNRILAEGTGATATGIKASRLKKVAIPVVQDNAMQKRLADDLSEIESEVKRLQAVMDERSTRFSSLRQSLLSAAFDGRLPPGNSEPLVCS